MNQSINILLVEDDVIDTMTVKRAFKELKITNPLVTTSNGIEALEYIQTSLDNLPGIILLDLNMPKMNGIELLKILKTDDRLRQVPVIVLTTSKEDQDKTESFNLGVAGYMIKPVDYLKFVEVIKTIEFYWSLSELPNCD